MRMKFCMTWKPSTAGSVFMPTSSTLTKVLEWSFLMICSININITSWGGLLESPRAVDVSVDRCQEEVSNLQLQSSQATQPWQGGETSLMSQKARWHCRQSYWQGRFCGGLKEGPLHFGDWEVVAEPSFYRLERLDLTERNNSNITDVIHDEIWNDNLHSGALKLSIPNPRCNNLFT